MIFIPFKLKGLKKLCAGQNAEYEKNLVNKRYKLEKFVLAVILNGVTIEKVPSIP